ncbi:cell wall-associated hydrolase, invasion-associated protein [Belliella baltica DSM 15883]|uniref:Cell wall-associated hydrolase, invasion-associated protein n=1 Tax=Belliella baltica (strain DSM 15883 / CIP 108006 / LMG 21964 / BA134) TaxID=866536 RepID=I3Z1S1_BELBD|nr:C40 family peptidase [Belliella baltica]AFL83189.1 cell wall-associated hydrolase, invasion-associated protein [Belliella baltica DSM 15883]
MKIKPRKFYKIRSLFLFISIFSLFHLSSCSSTKKIRRQNINQVVETAKSYRGTPYRYGGTTRSGIDCSALIFHAFSSVGVTMPRTSEQQSKIGKKIAERNLEKGDVVFFATGRKKRQVTHAGIVTANSRGQIWFIHSSTSLGVTEDNLNNSYWSKAYLFGRRVF